MDLALQLLFTGIGIGAVYAWSRSALC